MRNTAIWNNPLEMQVRIEDDPNISGNPSAANTQVSFRIAGGRIYFTIGLFGFDSA